MYTITNHLKKDRADRYMNIKSFIGLGKPIATLKQKDSHQVLTDTGVMLILSKDETILITCYVATLSQAIRLWKAVKKRDKLPKWLYDVVIKNQKLVDEMHKDHMII